MSPKANSLLTQDMLVLEPFPFARGSSGQIFKGNFQGQVCAAKVLIHEQYDKEDCNVEALQNEIHLLSSVLQHRNIVHMITTVQIDDQSACPAMVLEYCPSTLVDRIGSHACTMQQRERYALELSQALAHIHSHGYMHRDLKPANVLISSHNHIKLADFGLACAVPCGALGRTLTGETGTYRFMAPEVFSHHKHYNEKVDVYSFALLVYFIFTSQLPFHHITEPVEVARRALLGERPCIAKVRHAVAKCTMEEAWHTKAKDRPTMQELSLRFTSISPPSSSILSTLLNRLSPKISTKRLFLQQTM